jgi:serine/threonine protein kinase
LAGEVARFGDRPGAATVAASTDIGFIGTAAYMSPEQARGGDSMLADLFSFGVMLYQMLSGRCRSRRRATWIPPYAHDDPLPLSWTGTMPAPDQQDIERLLESVWRKIGGALQTAGISSSTCERFAAG